MSEEELDLYVLGDEGSLAYVSVSEIWRHALAAMDGKTIQGQNAWEKALNPSRPVLGSENHDWMAGICGYVWVPNKVYNGITVRDYIVVKLKWPFMGREDLSRIYVEWHLIPVLCIRAIAWKRGDQQVFDLCGEYLQAFAAYFSLSSWPDAANYFNWSDGRILKSKGWACMFAGSRSWSHLRPYKDDDGNLLSKFRALKPGMKPIHHLERHRVDEVVYRMLRLQQYPDETSEKDFVQCAHEAWSTAKGDGLRYWGITGSQATACREFVRGDASKLEDVLSLIGDLPLEEDHLFLRGRGGVAVINERERNSVSTSALYGYVYNNASVLRDGRRTRAITWSDSARSQPTRGDARYDWSKDTVQMRRTGGSWGEENVARKDMGYKYTVSMGNDERLDIGPLTVAVRVGPDGVVVLDPQTGEVPQDVPPPHSDTPPPPHADAPPHSDSPHVDQPPPPVGEDDHEEDWWNRNKRWLIPAVVIGGGYLLGLYHDWW